MRKIVYIFVTAMMLSIVGCKTQQAPVTPETSVYGVSVQGAWTLKPETLTVAGVDSLIRVDKLPKIEKWTSTTFEDDETGTKLVYRTLFDKTTGIIYTLKFMDKQTTVLSKRRTAYIK